MLWPVSHARWRGGGQLEQSALVVDSISVPATLINVTHNPVTPVRGVPMPPVS